MDTPMELHDEIVVLKGSVCAGSAGSGAAYSRGFAGALRARKAGMIGARKPVLMGFAGLMGARWSGFAGARWSGLMGATGRRLVGLIVGLMVLLGQASEALADDRQFLCELGLQAGTGYYVGDATMHIFNNPREAYGAHFRYKFTPRWALQVKGMGHRITGPDYDEQMQPIVVNGEARMWQTQMVNLDVMAEFNFFRFGAKTYDPRVKPLTPYIFAGIGVSVFGGSISPGSWDWADYGGDVPVACYIPVGFGLKWKFSERVGLNVAWQHNIYMADNVEGRAILNNSYSLNGSNILNFDVTSQFTLGIVFEFAREKKICLQCP